MKNQFINQKKNLILGYFLVFFSFYNIYASNNDLFKPFDNNLLTVNFTSSPAAVNGIITVCQGQTITYTDTSTGVGANPTYGWSFTGGNITSESNIGTHAITYNNSGFFTTTLTVNGSNSTVELGINPNAIGKITVPTSVTTGCGFYSITSIDYGAMEDSALLPSETRFGEYTFADCTSTTWVICNITKPVAIFATEKTIFKI